MSYKFAVSGDQGLAYLTTYQMWQGKEWLLIGPKSSFSVDGRSFFYGPLTYYLALPFLLINEWNPRILNVVALFLQLGALIYFIRTVKKTQAESKVRLFVYFCALTPFFINGVNFWNPHLTIPFAIFAVAQSIQIIDGKENQWLTQFGLGLFGGLGMQSHYGFLFLLLFLVGELVYRKKLHPVPLTIGYLVGFAPVVMFELRHNFYNLTTLLTYILKRRGGYPFYAYYLYSLIPLVLWKTSGFLVTSKTPLKKIISYVSILCFTLISFWVIFQQFQNFYSTVRVIPFTKLEKMAAIIASENESGANVIDLKTGDVRAEALRYLLTVRKIPLKSEDEYPDTRVLYIYSAVPIANIVAGSLWEMDVVKPVRIAQTWEIAAGLNLYKLVKSINN